MNIQIQRDKDVNFSMYKASIFIDNKKIGSVGNGQTATFVCPDDSKSLIVRSGPYTSSTFDLKTLEKHDILLSIGPKNKMSSIAIIGMGGAAVALSRLFDIQGLIAALTLVLLLDVTLLRVKWRVTERAVIEINKFEREPAR